MHNFQIKAPTFGPRLKLIGQLRDGRRIGVSDSLITRESSMALCRGYLIPPDGNLEQAQRIIAKFSPYASEDRFLIKERHILSKLPGVNGIPEMIARGKAEISYEMIDSCGFHKIQRKSPFFVMPELPGKDLDSFTIGEWGKTEPKREDVALLATRAFPALAETLAELHEKNVVHRDVKPNNVLFEEQGEGLLTLLDFGRANWLDAIPRTDHGTYSFFPPELILEEPEREDVRYDVYGLGATCFTTLCEGRSILFGEMEDPNKYCGLDFMFVRPEDVAKRYYQDLYAQRDLRFRELVARSNMPSELKETELGKYLIRLLHPNKQRRSRDMREIAAQLKKFGGELLEHEIWS